MRRDGDDDDPRVTKTRRNLSQMMREQLREHGIELDEEKPAPAPRSEAVDVEPDRDAIRAYLEPLGCPEWAIESCPSLELAMTYNPKATL